MQICGSYEKESVVIHAINLDHVIPFYNPSNIPFSYNQSTRKSFSRKSPTIKLSLKARQDNNNETNSGSLTSGKDISSQSSISFEMIDEGIEEIPLPHASNNANDFLFEKYAKKRESYLYSLPTADTDHNKLIDSPNPSSDHDDLYLDNFSNDLDYYPIKNSSTLNNVIVPEREDFPVNNAQPPDYAPKMDSIMSQKSIKTKINSHTQRKPIQLNPAMKLLSNSRKMSNSTIDLHTIDDNMATTFSTAKKSMASRNGSPTRNYAAFNNNNNGISKVKRSEMGKEINHARNNRKITVQIMTKPPSRSKTSHDLRASSTPTHSLPPSASAMAFGTSTSSMSQTKHFSQNYSNNGGGGGSGTADENAEMNVLTAYHERVHHELCNRYATIQLVRNSTR